MSEDRKPQVKDNRVAIGLWVLRLRKALPIETVIDQVRECSRKAKDEDKEALESELIELLARSGRFDEALQLLNERIERYPDEVFPLCAKAFRQTEDSTSDLMS